LSYWPGVLLGICKSCQSISSKTRFAPTTKRLLRFSLWAVKGKICEECLVNGDWRKNGGHVPIIICNKIIFRIHKCHTPEDPQPFTLHHSPITIHANQSRYFTPSQPDKARLRPSSCSRLSMRMRTM